MLAQMWNQGPFNIFILRVKGDSENKDSMIQRIWNDHLKFPLNSEDLSSPAMRTYGKFKDLASQLD